MYLCLPICFLFLTNHVQQLSTFCRFQSFAHIRELRLLLPFYPLSLLSQTSHLTLLVVAQFVVLWLVCCPTWNLYKKKFVWGCKLVRRKVPVSHFNINGTCFKPLMVCFVGEQKPRGMSRLPADKMPWRHSTTLHNTAHC